MIIANDRKARNSRRIREAYDKLHPFIEGDAAVRQLGRSFGSGRGMMHHKFLVGLSANKIPQWVTTGSYNASGMSVRTVLSICH